MAIAPKTFICFENFSPALTILFRNIVFSFFRIECNLPLIHLSHFNMHVLLYDKYLYLHPLNNNNMIMMSPQHSPLVICKNKQL